MHYLFLRNHELSALILVQIKEGDKFVKSIEASG